MKEPFCVQCLILINKKIYSKSTLINGELKNFDKETCSENHRKVSLKNVEPISDFFCCILTVKSGEAVCCNFSFSVFLKMGANFERFLHILSKWPAEINKNSMDYGQFLRQLVKNKDVNGNVFPGNTVENAKKLDSLLRLINNIHRKKYSPSVRAGATRGDIKFLDDILNSKFVKIEKN